MHHHVAWRAGISRISVPLEHCLRAGAGPHRRRARGQIALSGTCHSGRPSASRGPTPVARRAPSRCMPAEHCNSPAHTRWGCRQSSVLAARQDRPSPWRRGAQAPLRAPMAHPAGRWGKNLCDHGARSEVRAEHRTEHLAASASQIEAPCSTGLGLVRYRTQKSPRPRSTERKSKYAGTPSALLVQRPLNLGVSRGCGSARPDLSCGTTESAVTACSRTVAFGCGGSSSRSACTAGEAGAAGSVRVASVHRASLD